MHARRLTRRGEVDDTALLIHILQIEERTIALRDLILQRAGGQVVQIKLRPVAALTHPQKLLARPQHLPVRLRLPAVVGIHVLVVQLAHRAGRHVG